MRGEFLRADGLVIPNNIMSAGGLHILRTAFQHLSIPIWMGLCRAVPTPDLNLDDCVEPTQGVNGYARVEIPQTDAGWPISGFLHGEAYIESQPSIFIASGGNFDQPVERMFLTAIPAAVVGDVLCLSAALPAPLTISPTTPLAERTFRYRIYLR